MKRPGRNEATRVQRTSRTNTWLKEKTDTDWVYAYDSPGLFRWRRSRVKRGGKVPGAAHGVDIDADGQGVVTAQRLYQLVRTSGAVVVDHTFEIRFLDPGVQAYAFTFG